MRQFEQYNYGAWFEWHGTGRFDSIYKETPEYVNNLFRWFEEDFYGRD